MECPKCKKELETDTRFCPECGEKIEKTTTDLGLMLNRTCSRVAELWFMIGYKYSLLIRKNDEEGLKILKQEMRRLDMVSESLLAENISNLDKLLEKKE